MRKLINPDRSQWRELIKRPISDYEQIEKVVQPVINRVIEEGDQALLELTEKFDGVRHSSMIVSQEEMAEAASLVSDDLKEAIRRAKANIEKFHSIQREDIEVVETMPGVNCYRKSVPIERVGLYVPGGTAPLFSTVLMLGVPAKLAGCKEVVVCTPPDKMGKVHPAILWAANEVGVTRLFKIGGAQAIAAMAFGTETIPQVYKIFGPGNQYVTVAKQFLSRIGIAIDMPAGPSEVAVYADGTAVPAFVAADLLSQAEHGEDSQVILVANSEETIGQVERELHEQLKRLPRKKIAEKALSNSLMIVLQEEDAIDFLNQYAAEHLIISVENADQVAENVVNAGSVFLGNYTPESAGDYASGTNHTLPTNGFARAFSGVSLDSFLKKITFQKISKQGLMNLGPTIETMAAAEELEAHKNAVSIRLKSIENV